MNNSLMRWALLGVWLGCRIACAEEAPAQPAGQEEQIRFDILDFQVDGNTVLDAQSIEKAVYPYLGPGRSLDDVERARQKLESAYRENGYSSVLVEIPEQDVVEGRVVLQVVEGKVERLKITGSRYYSLGKIREGLPALAAGSVPHMPSVQEQVGQLALESGDRQLTPILRAGSTPGRMEAEIRVDDRLPVHGSLEMNGMNTEHTSRSRLIASLRYDNLWQLFHSASLQFQVSPENADEVQVWSGTYVLPTGWANTRLALYGVGIQSNNNLGAAVGGTNVIGNGTIFGARLVKPFAPVGDYLHNLSVGVDYKNFDQTTRAGQDSRSSGTGTRAPIRYLPFMVGYEGIWRGNASVFSANLAGHFSIRGLGNDQQEFEDKRYKAQSNFIYFTGNLKHQQELPHDMQLVARFSGQVADSPLISNEQFALGGMQTVRGYHQTQQLGDDGVNLSVELYSPNLAGPLDWAFTQNLRAMAFFDWGYLWILDPLPANPSYYKLAGTGVGLRTQWFKHWIGELDVGIPLYTQSTISAGKPRVDFRFAYEF